ncbi:hypothetical protein ABFX02_06G107100 [Erythranthe guttata]
MEFAKVTVGVRKAKKKQVNDELDRIKQAEKKRRRLEKALATSAAIRSELEKKKLKKKQEQERLDQEGAAIAEAVALQVLLGEDSDESMPDKNEGLTSGDHAGNINIIMGPTQPLANYCESATRVSDAYGCLWNLRGNSNSIVSYDYLDGGIYPQYFGLADGNLAAEVVSSLRIADDAW